MNPVKVLIKSLQVLSGKAQGTKRMNSQSEGKKEANPGGKNKRKQKKKTKACSTTKTHRYNWKENS